ncbi:mucin-2-like [Sycon ciliatum]|uniref:mucin-2-like n=1 Tax=Sycon ciliatum TaxID=27933 RepID=UPI0031F6BF96
MAASQDYTRILRGDLLGTRHWRLVLLLAVLVLSVTTRFAHAYPSYAPLIPNIVNANTGLSLVPNPNTESSTKTSQPQLQLIRTWKALPNQPQFHHLKQKTKRRHQQLKRLLTALQLLLQTISLNDSPPEEDVEVPVTSETPTEGSSETSFANASPVVEGILNAAEPESLASGDYVASTPRNPSLQEDIATTAAAHATMEGSAKSASSTQPKDITTTAATEAPLEGSASSIENGYPMDEDLTSPATTETPTEGSSETSFANAMPEGDGILNAAETESLASGDNAASTPRNPSLQEDIAATAAADANMEGSAKSASSTQPKDITTTAATEAPLEGSASSIANGYPLEEDLTSPAITETPTEGSSETSFANASPEGDGILNAAETESLASGYNAASTPRNPSLLEDIAATAAADTNMEGAARSPLAPSPQTEDNTTPSATEAPLDGSAASIGNYSPPEKDVEVPVTTETPTEGSSETSFAIDPPEGEDILNAVETESLARGYYAASTPRNPSKQEDIATTAAADTNMEGAANSASVPQAKDITTTTASEAPLDGSAAAISNESPLEEDVRAPVQTELPTEGSSAPSVAMDSTEGEDIPAQAETETHSTPISRAESSLEDDAETDADAGDAPATPFSSNSPPERDILTLAETEQLARGDHSDLDSSESLLEDGNDPAEATETPEKEGSAVSVSPGSSAEADIGTEASTKPSKEVSGTPGISTGWLDEVTLAATESPTESTECKFQLSNILFALLKLPSGRENWGGGAGSGGNSSDDGGDFDNSTCNGGCVDGEAPTPTSTSQGTEGGTAILGPMTTSLRAPSPTSSASTMTTARTTSTAPTTTTAPTAITVSTTTEPLTSAPTTPASMATTTPTTTTMPTTSAYTTTTVPTTSATTTKTTPTASAAKTTMPATTAPPTPPTPAITATTPTTAAPTTTVPMTTADPATSVSLTIATPTRPPVGTTLGAETDQAFNVVNTTASDGAHTPLEILSESNATLLADTNSTASLTNQTGDDIVVTPSEDAENATVEFSSVSTVPDIAPQETDQPDFGKADANSEYMTVVAYDCGGFSYLQFGPEKSDRGS